ncbi:protein disulfide isomerase [Gloeophyllum trabeum ATCC 11539]|uniref:Protein disulfide-isomerase n=1 Tax=Gloeophyllum trabeum (strain ATCC 11539 / FP-39264 / Madison 617) TaxID=670483 RepID=S7QJ65_GLOTA|nr:protein disulfide isomerase [Gloeophyllum trabeum ATCC 11539]EPQ59417.1 protein disulfide isomerase [Gloeophyllum trabeum ATCC 11539]
MRFQSFLSTASLLALAGIAAAEGDSDVIDLNPSNFQSLVSPEPLMLVEFFAPWCGHCKALAPEYEQAATALKEKNIKLAKVNCVDEADLCQAHGVQGYPTLKVFRQGEPTDYTGPRKADGIISYMTKQALPAVTDVTAANHEEFKKADKVVVVLYASSTDAAPAPEFSATANKHRDDYLFGLSTDSAAIEAAGVSTPAIVVYRQFDEPQTEYPYPVASATVKDLEDWIKELAIPIIDEVGAENYQTYAQSGKPLAYLFLDPSVEKRQEYIDAIRPVAAKFKGKVNFVWIDAIKFGDHARALNLPEQKWPAFVIQDLEKQLKYPLDQNEEYSPAAVEHWVDQYVDGKLQPQLKSQPIPETQDEPVFNLVGKQFDEVVFDDSKDVFVEFYASWCGHCKRLKPTWDSLGEKFGDVKDRVVIAKMEATENDLPPSVPFRISGFPTLKFKPAGSKEFLDYDGDRSLESLVAFVEEHAKNPLDPNTPSQNASHEHREHDEL